MTTMSQVVMKQNTDTTWVKLKYRVIGASVRMQARSDFPPFLKDPEQYRLSGEYVGLCACGSETVEIHIPYPPRPSQPCPPFFCIFGNPAVGGVMLRSGGFGA